MPAIVTGPDTNLQSLSGVKYDYTYPEGLDLRPDGELHKKIQTKLYERAIISRNHISKRYPSWRNIDKVLTTYAYTDEKEARVQEEDPRKPVSIILPYSYVMLDALVTYMMSAFIREPIFQYEGFSPEDIVGAKLMELTIQSQCQRNKAALYLHTMFRDNFAYGIAPTPILWETGKITVPRVTTASAYASGGDLLAEHKTTTMDRSISYEGNVIRNIDPYNYLPDPNVPVHEVQRSEFVGWLIPSNVVSLLGDEKADPENVFNAKYVKHLNNKRSSILTNESERDRKTTKKDRVYHTDLHPIDMMYMYVNLIPSEWGLGDSDYPEKWLFCLVSDTVIVMAQRLTNTHDKFPIAVTASDFDGYSSLPSSRIETVQSLQHLMDWLLNSHVANVRKSINDTIVYDPWMINSNDLKDPEPGKQIRLRRPAWGKGNINQFIQQLGVTDITRGNIADTSFIADLMQKVTGTDASMMGAQRTGGPERLTSDEFNGTRSSGMSRLERIAKVIGLQGMQDIGFFMAAHTQQYMSEEMYVKILGDWSPSLIEEYGLTDKAKKGRLKVSPQDLAIAYDVMIRDGSIPGSSYTGAWVKLFGTLTKDPTLRQQFDLVRIFEHIARDMGAKDVAQFRVSNPNTPTAPPQVKMLPDQQVNQMAASGQITPTGM